jgi:hypothetical protein
MSTIGTHSSGQPKGRSRHHHDQDLIGRGERGPAARCSKSGEPSRAKTAPKKLRAATRKRDQDGDLERSDQRVGEVREREPAVEDCEDQGTESAAGAPSVGVAGRR